jgi:hypothetical protein
MDGISPQSGTTGTVMLDEGTVQISTKREPSCTVTR